MVKFTLKDQIKLDERILHNKFLIHLFGNNLQHKTVIISTFSVVFNNFRFFGGIVNPTVERLEYVLETTQNATEFIIPFIKQFPYVQNFYYIVWNEIDHGLDQI